MTGGDWGDEGNIVIGTGGSLLNWCAADALDAEAQQHRSWSLRRASCSI